MIEERIVLENLSWAKALAKTAYLRAPRWIELEDLVSVAYLGLMDAAHKYSKDHKQGANFRTYSFVRITGEIRSFIRKEYLVKNRYTQSAIDERGRPVIDSAPERKDAVLDFNRLTESLNPIGRRILSWYYVDRLNMKEIADLINMSQSTVSKLVSRYTTEVALAL